MSPLFTGFSLYQYVVDRGATFGSVPYPDNVVLQLTEDTGLARYKMEPECNRTGGVYTGAVQGFTKSKLYIDFWEHPVHRHCGPIVERGKE